MTLASFTAAVANRRPPTGMSAALTALWHDGLGEWEEAHRITQDIDDAMGARIHAYLHRKEGDATNAAYWYRRAGVPASRHTLEQEWLELVSLFIDSAT